MSNIKRANLTDKHSFKEHSNCNEGRKPMMNSKGILSIVIIASEAVTKAGAFRCSLPSLSHTVISRQSTRFHGTVRPDASDAIADALRLSEEFGATSKEARVAWDIVEEMDANDSRPAYGGSLSGTTPDAPQDYYDHIRSLSYLLKETSSKLDQMKELVGQIKDMEIKDPSLARLPDGDESAKALKAALADAKAAVEVYGPSSQEAQKAWDRLDSCFGTNEDGVMELSEECDIESNNTYRYSAAALKAHHLYDAAIDSALLEESHDALSMIEGLAKFVSVEKRRLDADHQKSVGP